jgi:hypothetical protein
LEDCNSAIALDATYLRSFIHRAFVHYKMGNFDAAMSDCLHVLNQDKDSFPDLYFVRFVRKWDFFFSLYKGVIERNESGL